MTRKVAYPIGSISHGTMRNEDLIPEFVYCLKTLANQHGNKKHKALIRDIEKRMEAEGYYESDEADYDLNEDLFQALNEYAAPYMYFGAHPGDGSDFGFWLDEDMEDHFDGIKVSDLSEVPKDYAGEILMVNDHGNTSLYVKAKTQEPREVWALV